MQAFEIPYDEWLQQLNEFSMIHEGWLVSLEILADDLGAQHAIHNLPLLGVSAAHADHDGTIAITVERSVDEHLTHIIQAVTRIWVERTDDGADAALQIESADGTKTILRFRATALPETVDGLAAPRKHSV